MNLIEKLTYLKDNEYVINSKFYVVIHLPIKGDNWRQDFDLVFFADSGTVTYREHVQDLILSIEIVDERKVGYIKFK